VVNVWIADGANPPSPKPPQKPPAQLVVPNVIGLTIQSAQQTLSQAGLQPGKVAIEASTAPRGSVLAQLPQAGALVQRGEVVDLRSSDGSLTVVPDLRGRSRPEAEALLQDRGLRLAGTTEQESPTSAGQIIQHSPGPGARVARGSSVTIIVAKASTLVVPDLAGIPLQEARSRLSGSRLTVGSALPAPGEQPAGTVLTQDPTAGRAVPVGTAVHLAVSDGTLTRVPALAGLSEAAAQERLRGLGLAPGQRTDEESPQSPGEVVRQALAAGVLVARGTRLDYTVAVPQMHDVPKVTGLPVEEAAARLRALGLRITTAARRHHDAAEGTVIAQRPDPTARVQIGTEVAVEVSSGPRFGTLELILGIGAVLAAIGVVAVKGVRPAHGTESPTVKVTAHVVVPDVSARSSGPLKVEGPAVRIRARLETGPARVSEDRLVVRGERGNS
jgi:beta-lactam-binding protein with PASTA domain